MAQDTPNTPDFEHRLRALEQGHKDLDDAMLVHAHLEARAARRIKEHSEFIVKHEQIIGELDTLMREIGEKVSFLINREMKREGGPEAQ